MSNTDIKFNRWTKVWDVPTHDKKSAERHLAILALGIAQALKQKQMTAKQAWENGLNFKTYMHLKKSRADSRLLELWAWAMELLQVEKLGDTAMNESISAIETLASAVLANHHNTAPRTTIRLPRQKRPLRRPSK